MKNNKIPCLNISTESYTGKEQSPKGFGLSAEGFDINFEKIGVDNQIWIVQVKNRHKVWVRKSNMLHITHEEPILTNDIPSLLDNSININSDNPSINSDNSSINSDNSSNNVSSDKKKKNDYNIFMKYYLDKLKSENINNTSGKLLFQATTQEWARLKKNPDELKKLLELIKNK